MTPSFCGKAKREGDPCFFFFWGYANLCTTAETADAGMIVHLNEWTGPEHLRSEDSLGGACRSHHERIAARNLSSFSYLLRALYTR